MSEFKCPPRRNVRKRELPNKEGHLLEQSLAYKRKRSVCVSELTKAINKIKEYLNKNELSRIHSYNNRLDLIIDKSRQVSSSKLNELVCNDDVSEEVLHFCTDQELIVIEFRKSIYFVVAEFKQGLIPHDQTFVIKNSQKAYSNPVPSVVKSIEIAKVPRPSSLKSLDVKENIYQPETSLKD